MSIKPPLEYRDRTWSLELAMPSSAAKLVLLLFVLIIIFCQHQVSANEINGAPDAKVKHDSITYTPQYQRWGDFGSYHLGIKVTMQKNGAPVATWFMNGSWDTTLAHDTLMVYQIPALFPVFLKAYVHPTHPTSPIFNLRKWEEFGPTITISSDTATKLVTMSHTGMTKINAGQFMYSPLVKPFKVGDIGFWTSNSYVASLVHWANDKGQVIAPPEGGTYPGIDGPFIPKSIFEAPLSEQH